MALSNWSPYNIISLWSYARDGKRLSCLSQRNNQSVVGFLVASDLKINLGSDWKRTTRLMSGSRTNCYELTNVQSLRLRVNGRYGIHSLTEGMRYNVLIVVELLKTCCITGPLTCTLIDSTGHKHDSKNYYCSQMAKNQIISLNVGQFCARKSLTGYGEINFSMVNIDKEKKHGIVVIGALVVPVK